MFFLPLRIAGAYAYCEANEPLLEVSATGRQFFGKIGFLAKNHFQPVDGRIICDNRWTAVDCHPAAQVIQSEYVSN